MIDFRKGETKFLTAKIAPKNPGETIVITSAKFELMDKKNNNKIIQSGDCEVEDDEISALITTDKIGQYKIKMTVKIGRETIIEEADIIVVG